jgi:hypothetical protein
MLSIRVVPAAPVIVSSQSAVFPENDNHKSCELNVNGSNDTAAAVAEIHTIAMNIAITLKIRFICLSSCNKNIEVYFRPL